MLCTHPPYTHTHTHARKCEIYINKEGNEIFGVIFFFSRLWLTRAMSRFVHESFWNLDRFPIGYLKWNGWGFFSSDLWEKQNKTKTKTQNNRPLNHLAKKMQQSPGVPKFHQNKNRDFSSCSWRKGLWGWSWEGGREGVPWPLFDV